MTLRQRIETERAELQDAARTAARENLMTSATRLQGKADGLRWVLEQMDEQDAPQTEVECLVKGGRA